MREQTCIYKNNLVIALAFLLQFTAYNGIGNLQRLDLRFLEGYHSTQQGLTLGNRSFHKLSQFGESRWQLRNGEEV